MGNGFRTAGLIVLAVNVASVAVLGLQQSSSDRPAASTTRPGSSATAKRPHRPTPPYHKSAKAAKPFPPLVPANRFGSYPVVARAYQIANEIPGVLAQQPCFCNCDQSFGHRSLLDCYASDHTAGCAICVKEAFFTFQLTQQGKTPAEIRKAIIRGEWQKIDLGQPRH